MYHQRLSKLKLESLELRRLRSDLLFACKLVWHVGHERGGLFHN